MIGGALRQRILDRVTTLTPDQVVRKLAGVRVPLPVAVLAVGETAQELAVSNKVNAWRSVIDIVVFARAETEAVKLAHEIHDALHGGQWDAAGVEVRQVKAVKTGEEYTEDDGLHAASVRVNVNYRLLEA